MNDLASSPSLTPSSSPSLPRTSPPPYISRSSLSGETRRCVCTLIDITEQILDEDEAIRFKCLAYTCDGRSSTYHRCQRSSKDFGEIHTELFKSATEILLSKDEDVTLERFRKVIRMFFCIAHRRSTVFNQYFKQILPLWKGDGSDQEKELLKAIRQAYVLQHSAYPAPVVGIQRSSSPAPNTHSNIATEGIVAKPSDALLFQSPLPPIGVEKSSQYSQSLLELDIALNSVREEAERRHTLSVQARQVRSRSISQGSSISHQSRPSDGELLHESSQANMVLQESLNSWEHPTSQNSTPSPKADKTTSSPHVSTKLPTRDLPVSTTPNRHMRRQGSSEQIRSSIDHSQAPELQRTRQPTTNYPMSLESLNTCSPPSRAVFDFTPPAPRSQANDPSSAAVIPKSFGFSLPLRPLDNGVMQRPILNDQFKSASESSVVRPSAFTAAETVPALHNPAPETPSQVLPTDATRQSLQGSSSPKSYSLQEFANVGDWDGCLNPMISRKNQPSPMKIPHRQRSKDDSFLEQTASRVAAAALPQFQANKEPNSSVTRPSAGTERIDPTLCPYLLDDKIYDNIKRCVTKVGYIYILKSPKYFEKYFPNQRPLLKIGMTVDVSKRIKCLKETCKLFDLTPVADDHGRAVQFYWKVEELVHCELQNFRRVFKCPKCKNPKGNETEHREWYAVDEEVALRAVERWRCFIEKEPYDENGILKDYWSDRISPKNMVHPGPEEQWYDSQSRDGRWTKWLDEAKRTEIS